MKQLILATILILVSFSATAQDCPMVWNDEFDGPGIDDSKWEFFQGFGVHTIQPQCVGYRQACYTDEDVWIEEGVAVFRTREDGGKYKTSWLWTTDRFTRTYGYYEIRTKFTDLEATGQWNAFWLYPNDNDKAYDGNLDTGVEVDIYEYPWMDDGTNHAVAWGGSVQTYPNIPRLAGLREGFHTFGVDWQPEGYTFYRDGEVIWETDQGVGRSPLKIIVSVEIQNGLFGGSMNIDNDAHLLPDYWYVDYVRVYECKPDFSSSSCEELEGVCCDSGDTCDGGVIQVSSDCGACCVGGTCQAGGGGDSCSDKNGICCNSDQTCEGGTVEGADDCSTCCIGGTCTDVSETCSDKDGDCCEFDEVCSGGSYDAATDCDNCCVGGTCEAVSTGVCGDSNCDADECQTCPDDCSFNKCCGDGTCDGREDCESCAADCECAVCNDGICGENECNTCPDDCSVNACCGDGTCQSTLGETCDSCLDDCISIHEADNNPCDGTISISEMSAYLDKWKIGTVDMNNLMEVIILWKTV